MTNNNNNYQKPNYSESDYTNKNYYAQNDYNGEQSAFVPQSYGMGNRYDDLYDYEDESGSSGFLLGVIVGGLIGAAAALMLAPKSGKELRTDLNTQASTLKEKTSGYTDTAKEKSSDLTQQVKEKSSDLTQQVKEKSNDLTQQVKEQSTKVVEKVKGMKSGQSPMDDGTASSEGEETIEMLDTVQNSIDKTETAGHKAFTSTANALKEAVEEVKEEKKSTDTSSKTTTASTGSNNSNNSNKNTSNSSTSGSAGSSSNKNNNKN